MNGCMLTLAREARGMTQSGLSESTNISQPVISKIESGLRDALPDEIAIFAKTLNYPSSLFERTERIYKQSAFVDFMFRRGMSVRQRSLSSVWARLEMMALHLKPLFETVSIEPALSLPTLTCIPTAGGATNSAAQLRIQWRLPTGPITDLIGLVEAAGIVVVPFHFLDDKIDAVSLARPDMPPLMFIDFSRSPDRIRANVAHELGHLVMHINDREAFLDSDRDIEEEATDFSGDFLVPGDTFRNQIFSGIGLEEFRALKGKWGVSMQMLIMRSAQEGLISNNQKTTYFKMISARGWRKSEPGYVPPEKPTLLLSIINHLKAELGYSDIEISKLTDLHEEEYRSAILFDNTRQMFRIVNKPPSEMA